MKGDCFGSYFLILVLIVFFMLLYVYVGGASVYASTIPVLPSSRERFAEKNNELLPVDKIAIIQGNAVPDKNPGKITFDQNDPSTQPVDGTKNTPKSMFVFAYNKCDAKCCGDSPYSCSGGCVCLTDEQKKFLSNRGSNNRQNKCISEEY
jgi:hypothetical protein